MQAQAFDIGHSQGVILENPRVMVIAFRGTDSVADWLGNLQIAPRRVPALGDVVHNGFLEAYEPVASLIDGAVARSSNRALWFTGHSLGGALALISALSHQDTAISGLMTFGQPRLLSRRLARRVGDRFGQTYHRFVNRDDIVTRVPPGYSHSGYRVQFTGARSGGVEFSAEEFEPSVSDAPLEYLPIPQLSPSEFDELQQTIKAIEFEIDSRQMQVSDVESEEAAFVPDMLLDASVEGLISGVSAHRIDAYIAEVNARATAEISLEGLHETFAARRDVSFRREMAMVQEPLDDDSSDEGYGPESERPEPEATYLVRLGTSSWTAPTGVKLQSLVGNIASVSATVEGVRNLMGNPSVLTIEVSREAGVEDLSTSVPHVKGDAIHARPELCERGGAALVGIIDTGIDILHEAFNDEKGNSRVLAIWLQRDNSGPSPHAVDSQAFSQDYGTLYLAKDIAHFRKLSAKNDTVLPPGLRDEYSGHGTHVSSIAAGRKFADVGEGMAPDAGIIVVAAHTTTDPDEPKSIGYSSSHVDALAFLKRASQGGTKVLPDARPIAINVSLGMNAGAHDGQTTLEAAFDGITGEGRDPGIVIVKSAGNERTHAGHASAQAALGALVDVTWSSANNNRKRDYLEAWFEPGDDIEFTLITPDAERVGPVNFDNTGAELETNEYVCRMSLSECHSDNGHNRLSISNESKFGGKIPSGQWSLEMVARQVVSASGMVHIWSERMADRSICFNSADPKMTLSIPGTARTVITVGACNTAFPMRLLGASSLGLTRDGRPKPELCAPGDAIVAARAATATNASITKSGTSMAAPHVTGAVALVFSALAKSGKPQVNAVQLRQKLRLTTQNFSHIHNPGFGSGVLDAEKFFNEMT